MKTYKVLLKHDNGKVRVHVYTSSKEKAILQALHIENAPRNAVISVT